MKCCSDLTLFLALKISSLFFSIMPTFFHQWLLFEENIFADNLKYFFQSFMFDEEVCISSILPRFMVFISDVKFYDV